MLVGIVFENKIDCIMIGHRLYQMIFKKKWNRQAYELCRIKYGYQVPKNEDFEYFDKRSW